MLGIIIGVLAILLGAKAFTKTGLPWNREKNITGGPAIAIGIACILLGALFILDGVLASFSIWRMLSGG